MIQLSITADDLEACRKAYAAAWLDVDQAQIARREQNGPAGERTRAGLRAVLALLGIDVAVQTGGDPAG